MRRIWVLAFVVFPAIAQPWPSATELRELVRKSLGGLKNGEQTRDRFLFQARNERSELDAEGKPIATQSYTWERIELDGFTFGRTLTRNGKPLTVEERKAEDAAIQSRLAELKSPVKKADAAAATDSRRRRGVDEEWFLEFPDALEFKLLGEVTLDSRAVLHLDAQPRAGYRARHMRARVFEKMKGQLWLDKATSELVQADAEMFDTVSVGFGILGRIDKGTRFQLHRRIMADGSWLIDRQKIRFGARIMLVKNLRSEAFTEWTDFRPRAATPASRP
ncbi:MAG: hypothetical protein IT162_17870 [Bryobacterales bacterium]|nr:hypothetical protein [Bryobacterales bacterium]